MDNETLEIPTIMEAVSNEKQHIPSKFVFADHIFKGLEIAFKTKENIILHGAGGFAKSEMVNKFFKDKGIVPYVITLGTGTTIDSLLGGIDIGLFTNGLIDEELTKAEIARTGDSTAKVYIKKPGTIEYLVENSFMKAKYVVFEEMLDAPDFVLERLKDIFTSKQFRNGSQLENLETELVVCCTNKTRDAFTEDNTSLMALMERFPLEIKVEWSAYHQANYDKLFKDCFGETNSTLSYILEELHKEGKTISPRTAVKVLFGVKEIGPDFFNYVADFNSEKAKPIVKEAIKKYKAFAETDVIIGNINTSMEYLKTNLATFEEADIIKNIKPLMIEVNKIKADITKLNSIKKDDDLQKKCNTFKEEVDPLLKTYLDKIKTTLNFLDNDAK